MKSFVNIFDLKKVNNKNSEINISSTSSIPRGTPRKRVYQKDYYESFISKDSFKPFTSAGILLERLMTMPYFTS